MSFEWLGEFGWRDGVLAVIAFLTLYFIVMVLRLSRLRGARSRYADMSYLEAAPAIRTPPPEFDAPPGSALAGAWELPPEPTIGSRENAAPSAGFAKQLAYANLEGEMQQLQAQLQDARKEIDRLRGEVEQMQATHSVSPLYNEAMSMAVRGVDAGGIAGRCGISIAEAELVVALSRKPEPPPADPGEFDFLAGEDGYGRDGRQ